MTRRVGKIFEPIELPLLSRLLLPFPESAVDIL